MKTFLHHRPSALPDVGQPASGRSENAPPRTAEPGPHRKNSRLLFLSALSFAFAAYAQQPGIPENPKTPPAPTANPTTPTPEQLQRMGVASSLAEAKPLMDQYQAEQESLFQERRAALQRMQGKTEAEKRQIWQQLLATQKERLEKQHELAAKFADIEKQEREKLQLTKAGAAKPGKS